MLIVTVENVCGPWRHSWRVCIPDSPKPVCGKILGGGGTIRRDMWTMKEQGHSLITGKSRLLQL